MMFKKKQKYIIHFLSVIFIILISMNKVQAEEDTYIVEIQPTFSENVYIANIPNEYEYWVYYENSSNAFLMVSSESFYVSSATCHGGFLSSNGNGYILRQKENSTYSWANIWQNSLNASGFSIMPVNGSFLIENNVQSNHSIYSNDKSETCLYYEEKEELNINFTNQYLNNNTESLLLINYGNVNYINQYSIDNGESWVNVSSISTSISIYENCFILARIIDSENNILATATYNVTQINYVIDFEVLSFNTFSVKLFINFYNNRGLNQYSIDNGESWVNVKENSVKIDIVHNGPILARMFDSENNLITSSSYNISNIGNIEYYENVLTDDDDVANKLFNNILQTIYIKLPIIEELKDFFLIFTSYQAPTFYPEDYSPIDNITIKVGEWVFVEDYKVDLSLYNSYRPTIFLVTKISFAITFIIGIWNEFNKNKGENK